MQPTDAGGLPVTKCTKCWSANLRAEGMPGEEQASSASPGAAPPVPPELLEMFRQMFDQIEARKAHEAERCAALDEAEEDRRERVAKATVGALDAVAELARATTSFVKSLAVVPGPKP